MKTNFQQMRENLLARAGLLADQPKEKISFDALWKTQWSDGFVDLARRHMEPSPDFLELCRNRMVMGGMRYGRLVHQQNGNGFANVVSAEKRTIKFAKDGNSEWLCDIFNLAMIEWLVGHHPKAHAKERPNLLMRADLCSVGLRASFQAYEETGDKTALVEAAAICFFIWNTKQHRNWHWESGDRKENHPAVYRS